MKKLLMFLAAFAMVAGVCLAVDYGNHMYQARIYRVALGSGTAPSASDMATIRLQNGDMVLNTDDNVLYIMHETNVYTKVTSAGAMEPPSLSSVVTADTITLGGLANGTAQAKALGTNEVGSITASNLLINITGPTNAAEAVVTLTLPSTYQIGQFIGVRNAGTSVVQLVCAATTTNQLDESERCLLQAISTSEWEVVYSTP